jgi:hypothetical protein
MLFYCGDASECVVDFFAATDNVLKLFFEVVEIANIEKRHLGNIQTG